jgi:hypothetical protein
MKSFLFCVFLFFSLCFMKQLLKRVMKMSEAEPFNEPVDPVALGIPVWLKSIIAVLVPQYVSLGIILRALYSISVLERFLQVVRWCAIS